MRRIQWMDVACCLGLLAAQGCAWPSSRETSVGGPAGGTSLSVEMPAPANGTTSVADGVQPASHSAPTNSFTAAYYKAKDSITGALTIKPKVIPADDPTSLNGPTPTIGADLYVQAGGVLEARGAFDKAAEQYERAIAAEPQSADGYLRLARLYDRQADFRSAVAVYRRALKSNVDNSQVWNDLGLCLARQGQLDESLGALRRAVDLEPDKTLYRNNLAAVLVEAGASDEAFRQLIAVSDPAVAHYNIGFLLYDKGKHEEAQSHLFQALQHDPSMQAAQQLLSMVGGQPGVAIGSAASSSYGRMSHLPSANFDVYGRGSTELGASSIGDVDRDVPPFAADEFSSAASFVGDSDNRRSNLSERLSQPRLATRPADDATWGEAPLPAYR